MRYLFESRLAFLDLVIQFVADIVKLITVISHVVELFNFHDQVVQTTQNFAKDLCVLCVFLCKFLTPYISFLGRLIYSFKFYTIFFVFFIDNVQYCSRDFSH